MNTQAIKDAVSLAIGVAKLVDDSLGGISFAEVFELLGVLKEVKPAIEAVKSGNLWDEYKGLDQPAKDELIIWFDTNFKIKEANVQTVVEQAWKAVLDLSDLAKSLKP